MKLRRFAAVLSLVAVAGCSNSSALATLPEPTSSATPLLTPTPTAQATAMVAGATADPAGGVPAFSHVYVLILENVSYGEVVGNSQMPVHPAVVANPRARRALLWLFALGRGVVSSLLLAGVVGVVLALGGLPF